MLRKRMDIIREAVKKTELPQFEVSKVLKAVQDAVFEFMANGDSIIFGRLGSFNTRILPKRKARNPRTGEIFDLPVRRKAMFRTSTMLKTAVKSNRRGLDGEEKV